MTPFGQLRVEDWHTRRELPSRVRALVFSPGYRSLQCVSLRRAHELLSIWKLFPVVSDLREEKHIRGDGRESRSSVRLLLVASFRDHTSRYFVCTFKASTFAKRWLSIFTVLGSAWRENILHNQMACAYLDLFCESHNCCAHHLSLELGEDIQVVEKTECQ